MSKSYGKRNKGERLVAKRLCGYLREATATAPQEGQRLFIKYVLNKRRDCILTLLAVIYHFYSTRSESLPRAMTHP